MWRKQLIEGDLIAFMNWLLDNPEDDPGCADCGSTLLPPDCGGVAVNAAGRPICDMCDGSNAEA
ncbi:hypothetical protein [Nocardioides humi]|uniref:Uncharacterized protein n=1 Tax=Nocardioides humi TaxID=449461 RepID=A0ABN2BPI0_9ACTN|nr:hypothetical protein [Nocardioides humi]